MRVNIADEYRCSVDTLWDRVFFDDEYNRRLFLEGLRFRQFEKLEQVDRGTAIFRRIRGTPQSDMPATVQKVIGADLSYVEELTWDKQTRRARFKNTPARMAEKIRIEGEIRAEPAGEGRCRRLVDIDVQVKIFGVGGLIEGFAAKTFRDNFEAAARWTNKWLAEQGLEGK